jgi:phosphoribosylanthranilate isomerase
MTCVKICGITNLEDALAAAEVGADYLGFNFYPGSPRFIAPDQCFAITRVLKQSYKSVRLTGVFVNMGVDKILAILNFCSLDFAQLHGDEPPEMLNLLQGRAYKAFRGAVNSNFDQYISGSPGVPAGLLDAAVAGAYGGTGVTANWEAARSIVDRAPIFLAGGLNSENVAEAIRSVRPWGVDVASGVEQRPGKKDLHRLNKFMETVKLADQDLAGNSIDSR